MPTKRRPLRVGDRVVVRGSGRSGTIVHVYNKLEIRDVVAVRLDGKREALAFCVADLRRPRIRRRP